MSVSKIVAAASGVGGGSNLALDDVFSTHLHDGNGGTQIIENGIALANANDGGSARFDGTRGLVIPDHSGFQFGSGNWTIEAYIYPTKDDNFVVCSWGESSGVRWDFGWQSSSNPRILVNTSSSSQTSTASSTPISGYVGQWVHIACVRNGSDITLYVGGVAKTTMSYSGTGFPNPSTDGVNIGTRFYTGQNNVNNSSFGYITDFRIVKGTAVYTSNFTPSTSALTAISGTSFLGLSGDTPLADASGNSHSISQNSYNSANVVASEFGRFTGSSGEGGFVWIKNRGPSGFGSALYDTVRGATYGLESTSNTNAQAQETSGLTAFNSNGFTLGNRSTLNGSNEEYVSWTWRKASKFFDIVTYTGNGSARTISHNLGSVPGMIIIKRLNTTSGWTVYHRGVNGGTNPEQYALELNEINAQSDDQWMQDTAPTSTQFSLNTFDSINNNGSTYVAYLFAHHANDGSDTGFGSDGDSPVIACGYKTFSGNGEFTIDLGFEAQWVLWKRADDTSDWNIMDMMRTRFDVTASTGGGQTEVLRPNNSGAEGTNTLYMGPSSSGFAGYNVAGASTWIYMAIAHPSPTSAEPTDATKVFFVDETGSSEAEGTQKTTGFPVDMQLVKLTSGSHTYIMDRLRGVSSTATSQGPYLLPSSTTNEAGTTSTRKWDSTSYQISSLFQNNPYVFWNWKRNTGYFDMVCWDGTGSARTQSHQLNAVPEMMWVRPRNLSENWAIYHKDVGATKYLQLNTTAVPATSSTRWNDTTPTSSVFSLGADNEVNASNYRYIGYLFATVAGVSKCGSVSHTFGGGNTDVDCGFSSGCRFLLIKSTTHTYHWEVYDTTRGITTGNDPYLKLDANAAEVTNNNGINPLSSGFTLMSTGWNTGTYIFYAIA